MNRQKKNTTKDPRGFEICQWDINYAAACLIRGIREKVRGEKRSNRTKQKQE